jgi:hypothetical protein
LKGRAIFVNSAPFSPKTTENQPQRQELAVFCCVHQAYGLVGLQHNLPTANQVSDVLAIIGRNAGFILLIGAFHVVDQHQHQFAECPAQSVQHS